MTVQRVSDALSNLPDQLANAAKVLGRSRDRFAVFKAIYTGKKKVKSKTEIADITGLKAIRVLQEGGILAGNNIVERTKLDGETAYRKIHPFSVNYRKVLDLASNKEKLAGFATKTNPQIKGSAIQVSVKYPKNLVNVVQISIDEIDSFAKVRNSPDAGGCTPIDEKNFKNGIKRIIGEAGKFTDWGGEKNDLFTTRIQIKKRRLAAVFAFKGKGTKGILRPKMMGRNGDQIQRLFETNADLYVLQYWGQIDQSVFELMNSLAIARSAISRKKIFFCVIDGQDTTRIIQSYSEHFNRSVYHGAIK